MNHNDRYVWLDLLRGLSALAVCAGHLRAAMFLDYSALESATSMGTDLFYFATSLGHQAVMAFFVLSGFFVGGSILKNSDNFHFQDYLVARLSRLWVVLLPALIFTFFIDLYINAYHPSVMSGGHYPALSSGPVGEASSTWSTLFSNIFFLQTIYAPVFGSNGPLWSLAFEFWYYMIFPLFMIAVGYIELSIARRLLALFVLLLIGVFVAPNVIELFPIWLFGVVVYLIYTKGDVIGSVVSNLKCIT